MDLPLPHLLENMPVMVEKVDQFMLFPFLMYDRESRAATLRYISYDV
jgi:hypothetical protein